MEPLGTECIVGLPGQLALTCRKRALDFIPGKSGTGFFRT